MRPEMVQIYLIRYLHTSQATVSTACAVVSCMHQIIESRLLDTSRLAVKV